MVLDKGVISKEPLLGYFLLFMCLYRSDMWLGVASRTDTKRYLFKRDWTTCSNYDTYSRFNNLYIYVGCVSGGDLHDHLMSMRVLTLTMNKMSFANCEESGYGLNLKL